MASYDFSEKEIDVLRKALNSLIYEVGADIDELEEQSESGEVDIEMIDFEGLDDTFEWVETAVDILNRLDAPSPWRDSTVQRLRDQISGIKDNLKEQPEY